MARTCVILPAYNAEATVGPLVRRIKALGLSPIVVNDGSIDGTARVSTEAGAFVMSHVSNRGKGVALRTGFHYAVQSGFDYVVTMDSDGQHDPEEIPKLLAAAEQSPVVIGQRQDGDRMPAARRATNRLMSAIVSWLAGQRVPDSQCGFRVFRVAVLKQLTLSTGHFDLETEVLLAAARHGWGITSVPVRTIYHSHASHIHPVIDGLRFVWLIARYLLGPRGGPAEIRTEARS